PPTSTLFPYTTLFRSHAGSSSKLPGGVLDDHAPSGDLETALGEEANGGGVEAVLLEQNARGQRLFRVVGEDGHGGLQYDRPRVDALVGEVHGGARHLRAVLERLALRVQPGEGREQRGMDGERAP